MERIYASIRHIVVKSKKNVSVLWGYVWGYAENYAIRKRNDLMLLSN
jgi:hypothetical protein